MVGVIRLTLQNKSPIRTSIGFSTDTGKLIEHIYGFLMIVEQILQKYTDKQLRETSE